MRGEGQSPSPSCASEDYVVDPALRSDRPLKAYAGTFAVSVNEDDTGDFERTFQCLQCCWDRPSLARLEVRDGPHANLGEVGKVALLEIQ